MPRLALGTFRIRGEDARRVVADAVVAGYAHVDTASCYRNEEDIARALAALARDHPASQRVFLTSKLSPETCAIPTPPWTAYSADSTSTARQTPGPRPHPLARRRQASPK